jgi:hypothetical protein
MTVRCKLQLNEITHNAWGQGSIPEDLRFARATPSASMEMWVDNPAALGRLKLGEFYYVDFTPATGASNA